MPIPSPALATTRTKAKELFLGSMIVGIIVAGTWGGAILREQSQAKSVIAPHPYSYTSLVCTGVLGRLQLCALLFLRSTAHTCYLLHVGRGPTDIR